MTTESARRAGAVDDELMTLYPDAACALDHDGPFQLLVATVLSAQTTDARVNTVTPELFERYPDAAALGAARREDLEAILRPLGFQRAKAGHLLGIGQALTERFEGRVPRSREELVALPGVGRKTANVVLEGAGGVGVESHELVVDGARTPGRVSHCRHLGDLGDCVSRRNLTAHCPAHCVLSPRSHRQHHRRHRSPHPSLGPSPGPAQTGPSSRDRHCSRSHHRPATSWMGPCHTTHPILLTPL